MEPASRTNNVMEVKIREYANSGNVCVELDMFYLNLNAIKVSFNVIQEIHTLKLVYSKFQGTIKTSL